MRLLAIATVDLEHRREQFDGMVASVLPQVDHLVVIFRGGGFDPEALPPRMHGIATGRLGLSAARNVALAHLREEFGLQADDVLAFPDDDCAWGPDLGSRLRSHVHAGASVLLGRYGPCQELMDDDRYPLTPSTLSPRQIADRAASITMFLRASAMGDEWFDEQTGIGTRRPAGEDTDMVLRLAAGGHPVLYRPDLVCFHAYGTSIDYVRRAAALGVMASYVMALPSLVVAVWRGALGMVVLGRGTVRRQAVRALVVGLVRSPTVLAHGVSTRFALRA